MSPFHTVTVIVMMAVLVLFLLWWFSLVVCLGEMFWVHEIRLDIGPEMVQETSLYIVVEMIQVHETCLKYVMQPVGRGVKLWLSGCRF